MARRLAKKCSYVALVLALAIGVIAVATNNNFASAQPCQASLGSPNVYAQQYYSGGNFQVTLPVSVTCPFYQGQLYATGTAYDTTYNTNIGTTNVALGPTYNGYSSTAQLTFSLPSSAQSHAIQFSVSIYSTTNGYYGAYLGNALLAQASSTFIVGPSYYQSYYPGSTTYPTYPSYSTYPTYPNHPTYPRYTQNQGNYYMRGYYNYYHNNNFQNNNNYCTSSNRCTHR